MALGRRIIGPRDIVLPYDPAVDDAGSDFVAYRESLYDPKHLKFVEGEEPTRFTITPLTVAQKRQVAAHEVSSYEWQELVVRCSLARVAGAVVEREDGTLVEFVQPDRMDRPGLGPCASAEWIELDQLTAQDISMISAMAWFISEARPLSRKKSGTPPGRGEASKTETGAA